TGNMDGAIVNLRRADELAPGDAATLNNLGRALLEAKRAAEAGEVLHLAVAVWMSGQFDEAIPVLERAVQRQPEDAGVWDALGRCYWMRERFPEALAAYRDAVALEAGN